MTPTPTPSTLRIPTPTPSKNLRLPTTPTPTPQPCRSEELKVLLRDSNPGVICLQETKLGPEVFSPGLKYNIFPSAPPAGDRAHGGAAIIVHKSLQYSPLPVGTDLQAVVPTVVLNKQITICSIYLLPCAAFTNADIQSLLDQLPPPFFAS